MAIFFQQKYFTRTSVATHLRRGGTQQLLYCKFTHEYVSGRISKIS